MLSRIPLKVDSLSIKREVVLAEPTNEDSVFVIKNIPAFVYGVALGDLIKVTDSESGDFCILNRSGQVTLRAYIDGTLDRQDIKLLIDEITAVGGVFEVGANKASAVETSLLLVSIDVAKGFQLVESLMKKFSAMGGQWEYGNIYDQDENPLNWWSSHSSC
ncbi:DUF4265 domain-containing protein [Paraherbaspirillum soli]|uniref:DUF4265 domain-containing protein n=1 Tax=Paraherbaspirillum soli TaxID=631222 RepID=A0ABW0MDU3_9BURK